jgi:translation initiation factor 2B subunit (eIF-2B alpha/beta/delta family)
MRNQRQRYRQLVREAGLGDPDERTLEFLRDIVDEGVLGASNHVRLIQDLFLHLCDAVTQPERIRPTVDLTRRFIEASRGVDTPIIANSMRWLLRGLDTCSPDQLCDALRHRRQEWERDARARLDSVIRHGVDALRPCGSIMLFDYSSTVSAVIKAACEDRSQPASIVVFESRAIDGGWPYVLDLTSSGIPVRFLPDVAMDHAAENADAVLLGVEALKCDGSLLNTIGSRMIGRVARAYGAAVYGCCDLLKVDLDSGGAPLRKPVLKDFHAPLVASRPDVHDGRERDLRRLVATESPELEVVPPELVSGFITDRGVLAPHEIGAVAKAYFAQLQVASDA